MARKKTGSGVEAEIVLPSKVEVELGALAGEMREGLLTLAVGTGPQVMHFFLAVSKRVVPTRLFDDEASALAWLQEFVG